MYERITPPSVGNLITLFSSPYKGGEPVVTDKPIVPYFRGDGTGVDSWSAAQRFFAQPPSRRLSGDVTELSRCLLVHS